MAEKKSRGYCNFIFPLRRWKNNFSKKKYRKDKNIKFLFPIPQENREPMKRMVEIIFLLIKKEFKELIKKKNF